MKSIGTAKIDPVEGELKELAVQRNIELGKMNLANVDKKSFMKELSRVRQLNDFLRQMEISTRTERSQKIKIFEVMKKNEKLMGSHLNK